MDISIIIPAYNRLWSLPKAIESCRQTNLQTEIIVIDDGSTDGTWQWLSEQQGLICIRQQNAGKDWAVNKGFSIATGKYIRFLDSDDWLLPYSSDALFQKAEFDNLDVVCSGYHVFSETEAFIKEIPWTVCDDFLAQQLGECDSSHYSAYLFRKAFIEDIPHRQEYGARDDRQFIIETALKCPRFGYIEKPALAHRQHSKEKLQKAEGLTECFYNYATINIYKRAFNKLQSEGDLKKRYIQAAINILWPVTHWVAKTHLKEAVGLYKWINQLNPDFKIPDKGFIGLMYRNVGFKTTEKILKIRRHFKYGWQ